MQLIVKTSHRLHAQRQLEQAYALRAAQADKDGFAKYATLLQDQIKGDSAGNKKALRRELIESGKAKRL